MTTEKTEPAGKPTKGNRTEDKPAEPVKQTEPAKRAEHAGHPKRVCAILGSPRPNGITAAMLRHAIALAEQRGYAVDYIPLYEKHLAYCTGCQRCYATRVCVQQDDIQAIAAQLQACDVVILAAPVYWANVPAPVKNLFDRLLGTAMEPTKTFPKARLPGKRYLLLTACHTPAPFAWLFGQSRGAIRAMAEFFQTAGMKSMGAVVCANTGNKAAPPARVLRQIDRCWR